MILRIHIFNILFEPYNKTYGIEILLFDWIDGETDLFSIIIREGQIAWFDFLFWKGWCHLLNKLKIKIFG